jgi:hypothetical protein
LEALLLIQGGGLRSAQASSVFFWHGVYWDLMTSDGFNDGVQGGRKIPTARLRFRFGMAFVGVGVRSLFLLLGVFYYDFRSVQQIKKTHN